MTRLLKIRSAHIISALSLLVFTSTTLAADPEPLIKRLDDATRAKVLAALAGLIILGFAMVFLAWLGARITHRFRHSSFYFRPTPRPTEHDWAKKPLPPDDLPGNS